MAISSVVRLIKHPSDAGNCRSKVLETCHGDREKSGLRSPWVRQRADQALSWDPRNKKKHPTRLYSSTTRITAGHSFNGNSRRPGILSLLP